MLIDEINYESSEEEILEAINELKQEMEDEFYNHQKYCESQGWPSCGSNYESMCANTEKQYKDDFDYLYDCLSIARGEEI